jgi:uncharacterized membrane protein
MKNIKKNRVFRKKDINTQQEPHHFVNLSRLEALGDAIFAFALTLLALDLRLPDITGDNLAQGISAFLPKLFIFVFAFLVIAQEWDVHQRTMMHIAHADGTFMWLCILSLMFIVLMPASAEILGRYPQQLLSLVFFGSDIALFCLTSGIMWHYASRSYELLDGDIRPNITRMVGRLWLYPPIIILITLPLGLLSVYPVYVIWFLMPVVSYIYSARTIRNIRYTEG